MCDVAVKRGYKIENRNRKLTKLVKIVPYECEITHANFGGVRTTFVKVMAKKHMDPNMVAVIPYFMRSRISLYLTSPKPLTQLNTVPYSVNWQIFHYHTIVLTGLQNIYQKSSI